MSPGATFGMILMLGALIWCLANLARVVIGPHRKTALMRSGQSVFVFFVGAIVVGTFGGQQQGRTSTPTGDAARTRTETSTPPQPEPELTQFAPEPLSGASDQSPIAVPTVTARYQTSPTLVSLVVAGFNPAMVDALRDIATKECAGSDFCSVGFWTDDSMAPRTLRMSDEAVAARLAHYAHNQATGLDTFRWNCKAVAMQGNCL